MESPQSEEETMSIESELLLQSAQSLTTPTHPSAWRILFPATMVVFILTVGNQLSLAPSTAILEKIICSAYYLDHIDDSDHCKAEPIQSELSYILGWRDVFETLPGMYSFYLCKFHSMEMLIE